MSVVIGCSSGEERVVDPALEDYFQNLAANMQVELDCVAAQNNEAILEAKSDEGRLIATDAVLSGFVSCAEVPLDELEGLDPPPDAQSAHELFVKLEAEFLAFNRQMAKIATDALSAESLDAADAIVEINASFVFIGTPGGLSFRIRDACLALQRIADENDIDEDLICAVNDLEPT